MEGGRTYVKGSGAYHSDIISAKDIETSALDYQVQSISANMCCNLDLEELDEILQLDGPILYDGNTNSNVIQNLDSLQTTSQTKRLPCALPNNGSNCSQSIFTDSCSQPLYSLPLRQETDIGHSILLYSSTFQQRAEQDLSPFIVGIKEEAAVLIPTYLKNIEKEQSLPLKSIEFTFKKEETEDEPDFTLYPHRDINLSATPFVERLKSYSRNEDILPEAIYRDLSLIPRSIIDLHEIVCGRFTDFAFVYTLSAQICKDLVPMHSFVTLKMGLLLSIASIGNNENVPPLPILAMGPDNSSMSLIMNSIGNAAQRFITTLDDFQCGSIVNDNFIEAGPILLAKGGVCYLGDWSRLKNLNNNKILKDIERGSAIVEKTEVCYPIKSAVWTFITLYKNNKKDFITFNTLFEIFGVPLIVEDTCDESLSDFLLAQSCGSNMISQANEFYVPLNDIKIYLELVSKRKLDISGHANEILQKYFIAVRVDRPDCLPQRAFAALSQMSESFAKLSFRHVVLPIDVVSAIYLAEHFIKNSFGPGICPSPTLAPKKFVGDVDAFIKEFENWLYNYMARYADT